MQMEELEKTLSLIELNLLNATARYLLCLDLAERFQKIIDNRTNEMKRLSVENERLRNELNTAKIKHLFVENENIESLTAANLRLKNGVKKFQDVVKSSKNICRKCENTVYILTESSKTKKMHSNQYYSPCTTGAVGDVICNCVNSNKTSWITPTVTSQDVSSVSDFLHLY
jgi:sulfur transfer protein SufE